MYEAFFYSQGIFLTNFYFILYINLKYNNDFEIGIVDPSWSTLEAAALAAAGASSAFDYSANLLSSSASTAKSASIAASMNETQSSGGSRLALYGFLVFGVSLSFGYIFLLVL